MPFAIYRHEKIKTAQALTASANHMTRAADTPNADPTRAALNRVLIGSADPAADAAALIPAPDAVDEGGKKRRRSNSVLAIEILLTASPEWWAEATPAAQQDWLDRSTEWLVREYGRENIAHLRLHGDEQTPHLTGFIVPLDKAGHLNARKWIGGAARCRQQQTDYAAAVAPLGLSRGIEGSTAEHERVRRHYGQIAAPVAPLQIERPPRVLMNPEAWAQEQAENIAKQMAPTIARARTAESDRTARKAAEATAEKERRKRERTEKALVQQKGVADRMRVLPLPDVLTPSASSRTRPSATAGRPRASTSRSRRVRRPENGSTTSPSMGAAELSTSCSTSRAPILRALCPGWPIGSEKAQPPPILRPVCAQKPCARSKRRRPSGSRSPPPPLSRSIGRECGNTW